jgi:hypothetical protein
MGGGDSPPPLCLLRLLPRLLQRDEDTELLFRVFDVSLQESHASTLREVVVTAEVKPDTI